MRLADGIKDGRNQRRRATREGSGVNDGLGEEWSPGCLLGIAILSLKFSMFNGLCLGYIAVFFYYDGTVKSYALLLPLFGNPVTISLFFTRTLLQYYQVYLRI